MAFALPDLTYVEGKPPEGFALYPCPEVVCEEEHDRLVTLLTAPGTFRPDEWGEYETAEFSDHHTSEHCLPYPHWAQELSERFKELGICDRVPDHAYAHHYKPGQGMQFHTDKECLYEDTIVGVTLNSPAILALRDKNNDPQLRAAFAGDARVAQMIFPEETNGPVRALVQPGDVYVMGREARYDWEHAIEETEGGVLMFKDKRLDVRRRIAVTFRNWRRVPS